MGRGLSAIESATYRSATRKCATVEHVFVMGGASLKPARRMPCLRLHQADSLLTTPPSPPLQRIANLTTKPLVVVLTHGGPIDLSEMAASPRVSLVAWIV